MSLLQKSRQLTAESLCERWSLYYALMHGGVLYARDRSLDTLLKFKVSGKADGSIGSYEYLGYILDYKVKQTVCDFIEKVGGAAGIRGYLSGSLGFCISEMPPMLDTSDFSMSAVFDMDFEEDEDGAVDIEGAIVEKAKAIVLEEGSVPIVAVVGSGPPYLLCAGPSYMDEAVSGRIELSVGNMFREPL